MKTIVALVVTVFLLLSGAKTFAGDLTCYGYTSTTSHFACGTHGNCVWWAAYKRPDIAAVISGSGWNGGQWYDNLVSEGFDVGSVPKVGAIVEFSDPGHVAYVTSLGSNGSFSVSEMDYTGSYGNGVQYATYSPSGSVYKRNGGDSLVLKGFIYRRGSGSDSYCDKINSIWSICWTPSSTDVSCYGGKDWVLFSEEQLSSVIRVPTNEHCLEPGGIGGGGDVPDSTDPNLPNLQVRNITVWDANGNQLTEKVSMLVPGQVVTVRKQIISLDEDASKGTDPDIQNIETDLYTMIALDESEASWAFYARSYTEVWRMVEDNHHNEYVTFTVPAEAAGKRIYFKAKVDSTGEVKESNEHDNWSGYEWYPVAGNCDQTITYAGITGGRLSLREGERFGFDTYVRNIGTDPCPKDSQLGYFHKKPGQTDFVYVTDDHTEAHLLIPNQDNYELNLNEPWTADTPGTHELMVCANLDNSNTDANPGNNCLTRTFTVTSYRPDFEITQVGLTNGRTQLTLAERFGLQYVVTNNGTAPSPAGIRGAYYLMPPGASTWQYVMDDGSDAPELCVGCSVLEYTTGEPFTANQIGTWLTMVCGDYQGTVTELNEGNNCRTSSFVVNPVGPDFVVADLYLTVGSSVIREGGSLRRDSYVHPNCVVANIGNSGIHPGFRLGYYINWDKYRDSDGVDPNELCAGCSKLEYVSSNSIKLGDTGARTYRCCVDYQGAVPELNESNNCATMNFRVY